MPIKIADSLPAKDILENENIFVMTDYRAIHQDIRPLKLLILNLMPTKIVTETQLLRKLSNTPLQIEVEFLQTISHEAKNVNAEHLTSFYTTFDKVKHRHFDGMIITGAPVENLDFKHVDYWPELCSIMDWTTRNVHSTLHICWGAQAGLYYHYGIKKYPLDKKMSGVFEHTAAKPQSPFFRGFDDVFNMPHSRYTEVREEDIRNVPKLELMSVSEEAGVFAVKSEDNRHFFITGHPEYDADTLALEYARDISKGLTIEVPKHYFPNDDPTKMPVTTWRAHAQLLYTNWLNYYVYQSTPYDIDAIGY
jgi:homoserine O-succinyltransferase